MRISHDRIDLDLQNPNFKTQMSKEAQMTKSQDTSSLKLRMMVPRFFHFGFLTSFEL